MSYFTGSGELFYQSKSGYNLKLLTLLSLIGRVDASLL